MENGEMEEKTTLCIRVGKDTKAAADRLFRELGLPTSEAINIFFRKCIRMGGIPFEISLGNSQNMKKENKVEMGNVVNEKIGGFEMTTENKETIIPWFLDYTGTTDILLDGGAENVKEFFDSIKQFEEELGVKVLLTIVTGSACESARSKYIQFQNLAENYGMPGLFDGVIAEYCGYNIKGEQKDDQLLRPIDGRIEQRRAEIEELAKEYGGELNPNNKTYYNILFPDTISEESLKEFRDRAKALMNQSDINPIMYYDDYGKECDIKEDARAKYNSVRMKVNNYRNKYNVAFVMVGGDSKGEDLMMYTENKKVFEEMGIGSAFMAPRNIGELQTTDENVMVGEWDNAKGVVDCARRAIPGLKAKLVIR